MFNTGVKEQPSQYNDNDDKSNAECLNKMLHCNACSPDIELL